MVEKMSESKFKILVVSLVSFLLISTILPSYAFAQTSDDVEGAELAKLEQDLEFLFEEATTEEGDKYVLDEEKAKNYFGEENLPEIKILIKLINEEEVTEEEFLNAGIVPKHESYEEAKAEVRDQNDNLVSNYSWLGCMKTKIIAGTGLGFFGKGIDKLIEDKNWKKLSKEIIKIVGKNAVRGGAVGLAASLAVWSTMCIGK